MREYMEKGLGLEEDCGWDLIYEHPLAGHHAH